MKAGLAVMLSVQLAFACSFPPPAIWWPDPSGNPLFRFERDGKVGFIDSLGRIVIEPTLDLNIEGSFRDGLLSANYGKGLFIDATGREAINKPFAVYGFSEGLAPAVDSANLLGYIDTTGAWSISPRFVRRGGVIYSFSEGRAVIESKDRVAGYIDSTGTFVIPQKFFNASSFSDGVARVLVSGPCLNGDPRQPRTSCDPPLYYGTGDGYSSNDRRGSSLPRCRWSFIDKEGKRLFSADFEAATDFHQGLAAVRIAGKWGFIDKRGVVVIQPVYNRVNAFSEGLAFVDDGKTSGYINALGQFQFATKESGSFSEGLVVIAARQGGAIYVDKSGQQVIPGSFLAATPFVHGLAHVMLARATNGEADFAYIDHTGKRIFTYHGRL